MEKCSLCLKKCVFAVSVQDSDENNVKWFTKLQYIIPELEWSQEYRICEYCTKQLKNAWEFKKFVLSLEEDRRNEMIQVEISPDLDGNVIEYFYNEKTFTPTLTSQVHIQDKLQSHNGQLSPKHKSQNMLQSEYFNESESFFICYNCNKNFNRKDNLVCHIENEHKKLDTDIGKVESTDCFVSELSNIQDIEKYQCNMCNKFHDTEEMLLSHFDNCMKHVGDENLSSCENICKICCIQFTSNKEYISHNCSNCTVEKEVAQVTIIKKRRGRKPLNKFTCEICGEEFDHVKLVIQHCESVHRMDTKVKPYTCAKCNMRFASAANLDQHRNYHDKNRTHICSSCGKGFITKSDLTVHEYIHYNRRNYKCTICDKAFNTNKNLRTHNLVVHTDRSLWKYGCSICEKRFPLKTNYEQHLRRHTGEKEHICHICKKPFISKSELQRHIHMHSNIRAFKCNHCDKEYKERRTYQTHLAKKHGIGNVKITVREKKFVCHICPSQFYDKQKLMRHICSHSGLKPFSCHICDKKFTDKSYLKHHLKTVHGVIEQLKVGDLQ